MKNSRSSSLAPASNHFDRMAEGLARSTAFNLLVGATGAICCYGLGNYMVAATFNPAFAEAEKWSFLIFSTGTGLALEFNSYSKRLQKMRGKPPGFAQDAFYLARARGWLRKMCTRHGQSDSLRS